MGTAVEGEVGIEWTGWRPVLPFGVERDIVPMQKGGRGCKMKRVGELGRS